MSSPTQNQPTGRAVEPAHLLLDAVESCYALRAMTDRLLEITEEGWPIEDVRQLKAATGEPHALAESVMRMSGEAAATAYRQAGAVVTERELEFDGYEWAHRLTVVHTHAAVVVGEFHNGRTLGIHDAIRMYDKMLCWSLKAIMDDLTSDLEEAYSSELHRLPEMVA